MPRDKRNTDFVQTVVTFNSTKSIMCPQVAVVSFCDGLPYCLILQGVILSLSRISNSFFSVSLTGFGFWRTISYVFQIALMIILLVLFFLFEMKQLPNWCWWSWQRLKNFKLTHEYWLMLNLTPFNLFIKIIKTTRIKYGLQFWPLRVRSKTLRWNLHHFTLIRSWLKYPTLEQIVQRVNRVGLLS